MKSHLISQVLLRRFSINNFVKVTYLNSLASELKSPKEIGYINLPDSEFSDLEKRWHSTEKRVNEAFKALDNGSLLRHPEHIETIKRLMGIHYLRSNAFFVLLAKTEPQYFNQFINEAIQNHPKKKQEILKNIDALRNKWYKDLKINTADLLKKLSGKVENYIMQYDIEIGVIQDKVSLILSDNPAINITKEGKMGILSGISIDNSDGFVMPLGSKHIAASITKNLSKNYRRLFISEVGSINAKAIKQSIKEYYSPPSI